MVFAVRQPVPVGFTHDFFVELFRLRPRLAHGAIQGLPEQESKVYLDKLQLSLPETLRRLLMDMKNYEYQSDFARRYILQGREEGREEGRVALLCELLAAKFGALPESVHERLRDCDEVQQRAILTRVLSATSLDEALGSLEP